MIAAKFSREWFVARLCLAILFVAVLCRCNSAGGEVAEGQAGVTAGTDAQVVSLADAIEAAAARYPAIRAAEQQRRMAQEAVGVAQAAYYPRADLLWQGNRATTNRPNVAAIPQPIVPIPSPPARAVTGHSDWNTATGVLFAWQPFDFGVRHAQVGAAKFNADAAKSAEALTRLDVESWAAGAFLDVVAARQLVSVQQANVHRMEELARAIHVLVDNTLRPGADASQADAQLALARTQLIEAETQQHVHLEALANLLQAQAASIRVDDAALLGAPPADVASDAGIDAHPAVQQQAALVGQQQQQLRVLDRSWVPSFSLLGSVSGLGAGLSSGSAPVFQGGSTGLAPQTYNWMAAVQVTFPALQIFTLRPQRRSQEAEVAVAEATRDRVRSDLSAQVKEARALLEGARRVAENTPVELEAARQSEQQQRARYQSGLATVIDVSAAEAVLAQAEGDDAVARLNVWRGLAGVAEAEGDFAPLLHALPGSPQPLKAIPQP